MDRLRGSWPEVPSCDVMIFVPESNLWVENQSSMCMHSHGFLHPMVGLASFLENNFHVIKPTGSVTGVQEVVFLQCFMFVSGVLISCMVEDICIQNQRLAGKVPRLEVGWSNPTT